MVNKCKTRDGYSQDAPNITGLILFLNKLLNNICYFTHKHFTETKRFCYFRCGLLLCMFLVYYINNSKNVMLLSSHHINNCVYLYWKQHHFVWLTDRCCCTCLWLVMTCRIPLTNPLWSLGMSPMKILFLDEYSSISTRTSHGALWGKCTQPAYTHTHTYIDTHIHQTMCQSTHLHNTHN